MTDPAQPDSPPPAGATLSRVLVTAEQIRCRVDGLADQIAREYQGRELVILAVMTGSLVFLADLIRRLPLTLRLLLVSAKSYEGTATCSNGIKSIGEVSPELAGRDVLILDDIIDSGHTLRALIQQVQSKGPRSVRTCVLLKKLRPGIDQPTADYLGFEIGEEFVVGYGLDFDNLFRNLPDLCALTCRGEEGT